MNQKLNMIVAFTIIGLAVYSMFRPRGRFTGNPERELWVKGVETKWTPSPGLFAYGTAEEIAEEIFNESPDYKTGMSRLNFYINRAGTKLSGERRRTIEEAKDLLASYHGREIGVRPVEVLPLAA